MLDCTALLCYAYLVILLLPRILFCVASNKIHAKHHGHYICNRYVFIHYFFFILDDLLHSAKVYTKFIDRNPNKAGSGDPYWPSYKSRKAYLQLDDHVTTRHDLLSQRLVTLIETVPRIMANDNHVGQPFG